MTTWKQSAVADRKAIAKHIVSDNPVAAVDLVDLLIEKAALLDGNPKLGRTGRMEGIPECVVHPHYVIVYHLTGKPSQVEILRVLHSLSLFAPLQGECRRFDPVSPSHEICFKANKNAPFGAFLFSLVIIAFTNHQFAIYL